MQSAGSTRDTSIFVGTTFVNLSLQAVSPKPVHVREPVLAGGILAGGIKLVALGTHDMVADTFTKRLPAPALVRHRQVLNF
jgi:hypothetical protein